MCFLVPHAKRLAFSTDGAEKLKSRCSRDLFSPGTKLFQLLLGLSLWKEHWTQKCDERQSEEGQNCSSSTEFLGKRWQCWFGTNLFTFSGELRTNKKCQLYSLGRAVDKWAWQLWKMPFWSQLVALTPSVTSGELLKPELKLLRFKLRFPSLGKGGWGGILFFPSPSRLTTGKNENP